jgi:hypothetical protein
VKQIQAFRLRPPWLTISQQQVELGAQQHDLTNAILDKIVHHSHRIEPKTKGESLRESLLNGPLSDTKRASEGRADN